MEAFWKWLMRANAHAVFYGSLLALILVTGWWCWKEFQPAEAASVAASVSKKKRDRQGLGVRDFLQGQLEFAYMAAPGTPFYPLPSTPEELKTAVRKTTTYYKGQRKTSPADSTKKPDELATKPIERPVEKVEVPETMEPGETVSLTYKGIFRREDGAILALIADSKTQTSAFYEPGREMFGFTVGSVDFNEVSIILADESSFALKLGEEEVFENGRPTD